MPTSNNKEKYHSNQKYDLMDQTFGQLRVIGIAPPRADKKGMRWLCECSCGKITHQTSNALVKGGCYSCGCSKTHRRHKDRKPSSRRYNLIGQKFGSLLVISIAESTKNGDWLCQCECGKSCTMNSTQLRKGRAKSCGCKKAASCRSANSKPPGYSGATARYSSYRSGAKRRNLIFPLTRERFIELVQRDCFYCGRPPQRSLTCSTKGIPIPHSKFCSNGIDRVDSSIGYVEDNIVTACADCNVAKQALSQEAFFALIKLIYEKMEGLHEQT